jgi:hypothetical protein
MMKYREEIVIDLPRGRVIELFDDPQNPTKWQPGLKSFELVSGEAGQPGARSRLVYDENGRKIEMIETIERRDMPDEFTGTYEASGLWNRLRNRFNEEGPGHTRWVVDTEFQFSGLMKVVSLFMRGSFAKQTRKMMGEFKSFAEEEGELAEGRTSA